MSYGDFSSYYAKSVNLETQVQVNFYKNINKDIFKCATKENLIEKVIVTIPTKEIWQNVDIVERKADTVTFPLIEKWLYANGIMDKHPYSVRFFGLA